MQMFLLNINQNEFKSCLHSGMLIHGCSTASEPNRLLFSHFLCSWKIVHTLGCAFKISNWMGHLGTQGSTCSAKNLQAQIEMNWKIYICYLVHLPVQRFCLGWSFMLLLYHYFWKKMHEVIQCSQNSYLYWNRHQSKEIVRTWYFSVPLV